MTTKLLKTAFLQSVILICSFCQVLAQDINPAGATPSGVQRSSPVKKASRPWFDFRKPFKKEVGLVSMSASPSGAPSVQLLTLDECINIAAANNIQLQMAKKGVKLAEMKIYEARRNMLTTATIVYEQYHGRFQGRAYFGRKQYIEGQQPVFNPELFFKLKGEERKLEIQKNEYKKARNELVMQVKKAYYSLAKAKENLRAQEELYKGVTGTLDMVNKEYDAGVIPKVDMLNVTAQANQARFQYTSARNDLAITELTLKNVMMIDSKEAIDIDLPPEFRKITVDLEDALAAANVNRPEIRINQLKLDYYGFEKDVAKARMWPRIDLLGNWGLAKEEYMSPDFVDGVDVNQRLEQQWYGGVKVTVPFWGSTGKYSHTREQWQPNIAGIQYGTEAKTDKFEFNILDKLSYYSDKQLADIDVDRARQELIKSKQDTALEVREGCYGYEKALIQLDWARAKIEYQYTDLEIKKMKRGLDEALDSDVVESMIKLAQEKFVYAQAVADCYISIASINKAIGVEDYFNSDKEIKHTEGR